LKVAAAHVKVPWQAPQSCTVWTCCVGFPVADTPLWQLTQLAVTPR
jgi:hypothetical protein